MRKTHFGLVILAVGTLLVGCGGGEKKSDAGAKQTAATLAEIEKKWGKPYDQLEELTLVAVSPHNKDIETEFEKAFSLEYALKHGKRVEIQFRDVGGGGSKILSYLRTVYEHADTSGIDIIWGGGDDAFDKLAADGVLQPLKIAPDVKANIPPTFGGLSMIQPKDLWCGAAVSGFGFMYNKPLLEKLKKPAPATWDDLADAKYNGLIALADPMKSSSATAAYKMIAQSAPTWPAGWAKLLDVLSNANKFYDGASGAADAVVAEAPIAACIDFYGTMRVNKYPKRLVYVSPKSQTVFNADPIAILKNPPHGELAQAFVDFVLSPRGQALWGLKAGEADGPVDAALYRMPIRKDVYTTYEGKLLPGIANPFQPGNEMAISDEMRKLDFNAFRRLVYCASVANAAGLKQAREKLIAEGLPAGKVKLFHELPPNIRTMEEMQAVVAQLRDEKQAEKIMTDWADFFAKKYDALSK